jgi:hypothetical protein
MCKDVYRGAEMETKHTKGPWEVFTDDYSMGIKTPAGILFSGLDNTDDEDADFRLIAAAPEMLAALREINQHLRDVVETQKNGDRNNWESYYVPEFAKLSQKFSELIAKAESL